MNIENNGPQSAYPAPDEKNPDAGEREGSGSEQTSKDPAEGDAGRPADWDSPPGNPGSDQDAQVDRDNDTADTDGDADKDLGFDPDSPDVSDPEVDPLHPAKTSNDPISRQAVPGGAADQKLD